MWKITLLTIGHIKEPTLKIIIQDYVKKIAGYSEIFIKELEETPLDKQATLEDIQQALKRDGEKMIAAIPKQSWVVILDRMGKSFSSEEMANQIHQLKQKTSHLTMIIGGSHGLHETVKSHAQAVWSFSKLTFPHQLFRVLVLEQLYRGLSILAGHPYHK